MLDETVGLQVATETVAEKGRDDLVAGSVRAQGEIYVDTADLGWVRVPDADFLSLPPIRTVLSRKVARMGRKPFG